MASGTMYSSNDVKLHLLLDTAGKTAPTPYSSRLKNITGGYVVEDGYCYVCMTATTNSALSSAGFWTMASGFPVPNMAAPLGFGITVNEGRVITSCNVHEINGAGYLFFNIVDALPSNIDITLTGVYKVK